MKKISTEPCETLYEIEGVRVLLWIITGGTPAIDFDDNYTFCKRFPEIEKWGDENYRQASASQHSSLGRYKHQTLDDPQGPTCAEVLPNGEQDLLDWFAEHKESHALRKERSQQLAKLGTIKSRRFHDKEHGAYAHFSWSGHRNWLLRLSLDARAYTMQYEPVRDSFVTDPNWRALADLLIKLRASTDSMTMGYDELTTEQFDELVRLLILCKGKPHA